MSAGLAPNRLRSSACSRSWRSRRIDYFGSIPKASVLDIASQAASPEAAAPLATLKKAAHAKAAEERLAGSGWLPAVLRTTAA